MALLLIGVFGAALFYGDSVITPAISVLSAVEGLEVVTPAFKPYVLPISLGVLIALFAVQRFGTGGWASCSGRSSACGSWCSRSPAWSRSCSSPPSWRRSIRCTRSAFMRRRVGTSSSSSAPSCWRSPAPRRCTRTWGTSASGPIQIAWTGLVLPSLALNYLGQGALLMRDPRRLRIRSTACSRQGWLMPAVVLATVATIIASQAVITGAYSLTKQAMQLGLLPRMQMQLHLRQGDRPDLHARWSTGCCWSRCCWP